MAQPSDPTAAFVEPHPSTGGSSRLPTKLPAQARSILRGPTHIEGRTRRRVGAHLALIPDFTEVARGDERITAGRSASERSRSRRRTKERPRKSARTPWTRQSSKARTLQARLNPMAMLKAFTFEEGGRTYECTPGIHPSSGRMGTHHRGCS
jgi:hypothetical protein